MADRTLVTCAGAALTATGALAFVRVFDSGEFVVPTLGAAALPFLVGLLLRRARLPAAVVVATSLVAGIAYLLVAVQTWTPFDGWPLLGDLRAELRAGVDLARTEPAPVAPTTGTILLVVAATWCTALIVDQLAARAATTGALVPPLALFVVAIALGPDEGGLSITVAFAIAAIAFLLVQHQLIVGRHRGRFFGRRTARGTGLLVGGATLGAIAVLGGTAIAPALPGANADPLFDYRDAEREGQVYEPGVPPVLDVGARLQQGARTEVFRVRATEPAYWRLVALDEYDGNWVLDAPEGSIDATPDRPVGEPFVQDFTIGRLGERWMPAAYEARRVEGAEALVIRDSATLVSRAPSVDGLRYRVVSELPVGLDDPEVARAAATGAAPPDDLSVFTELPDGFSDRVASTAREATAGATTPFEQAEALHAFFRDPSFVYDPNARYNARGVEDGEEVVELFLEERRGFCVQYAGAYAVMARSLGIPTRMVVGFTPGTRDGEEFVVTNHEAHAWPEVWLDGIGWTAMFDPTPPSRLAGGSDLPNESAPAGEPGLEQPGAPGTPEATPTTVPPAPEPESEATVEVRTGSDADASTPGWWRLVAIPAAIAALVGGYVAAVAIAKRRRRARRHGPAPRAAVTGAWREALDRVEEAGTPTPPASTPHELAEALAGVDPDAGAALRELAGSYVAARYGDLPPTGRDVALAWEQVVAFEAALAADVTLRTRWRRRLRVRGAP